MSPERSPAAPAETSAKGPDLAARSGREADKDTGKKDKDKKKKKLPEALGAVARETERREVLAEKSKHLFEAVLEPKKTTKGEESQTPVNAEQAHDHNPSLSKSETGERAASQAETENDPALEALTPEESTEVERRLVAAELSELRSTDAAAEAPADAAARQAAITALEARLAALHPESAAAEQVNGENIAALDEDALNQESLTEDSPADETELPEATIGNEVAESEPMANDANEEDDEDETTAYRQSGSAREATLPLPPVLPLARGGSGNTSGYGGGGAHQPPSPPGGPPYGPGGPGRPGGPGNPGNPNAAGPGGFNPNYFSYPAAGSAGFNQAPTVTGRRREYTPDYRVNPNASYLLVGGIVGYLIGRRRGRIKTEKRMRVVQRKLEKQVEAKQQEITRYKETAVKQAREAYWSRYATRQEQVRTPTAETVPARHAAREALTLAVAAPEAVRGLAAAGGNHAAEAQTLRTERPRPHTAERAEAAASLPHAELLQLSEKVVIGETNLRKVYEAKLVSESGLRRLVQEHLEGRDIRRGLAREFLAKELSYERDPRLRDALPPEQRHGQSGGSAAAAVAADATVSNDSTDAALSAPSPSQSGALSAANQKSTKKPAAVSNGLLAALTLLAIGLAAYAVILSLTR